MRQTLYAVTATLLIWAVAVLSMAALDNSEPNTIGVYSHDGTWTIYQDVSGRYSVPIRGLVRVSQEGER